MIPPSFLLFLPRFSCRIDVGGHDGGLGVERADPQQRAPDGTDGAGAGADQGEQNQRRAEGARVCREYVWGIQFKLKWCRWYVQDFVHVCAVTLKLTALTYMFSPPPPMITLHYFDQTASLLSGLEAQIEQVQKLAEQTLEAVRLSRENKN